MFVVIVVVESVEGETSVAGMAIFPCAYTRTYLADREPVLADEEAREEGLGGGRQRVAKGGEEEEAAQHHLVGCFFGWLVGWFVVMLSFQIGESWHANTPPTGFSEFFNYLRAGWRP